MLAQGVSSPSVTSLVETVSTSSSSAPPEAIQLTEIPVVSSGESSAGNLPVSQVTTVPNHLAPPAPPISNRKKKPRKVNPGAVSSPQKLALQNNACEIVINSVTSLSSAAGAASTSSSGIGSGRKRSRKQQIGTFLTDEISLISPPSTAKGGTRKRKGTPTGKRKSGGNKSKKTAETENDKQSSPEISIVNVKRVSNSSTKTKTASSLLKQIKKSETVNKQPSEAKGPEPKIVLDDSELVSVKRFRVFVDQSRDIPAIGPSQVLLAAETLIESGCQKDLEKEESENDNNNAVADESTVSKSYQFETSFLLSTYLSTPHYLPLSTVYSPGVPFTRILKFSTLEEFTGGVQQNNSSQTHRYLNRNPPISLDQYSSNKGEGFLRNTIVIKYPIIGRFSEVARFFKFFVLKKVKFSGIEVAVLRAKVVTIQRTEDKNTVVIKTDETRISELPSDANAMSQRNIQPVIHTDSDLVPIINRTTTGYLQQHQQQYQLHAQPQYQQQQPHFQYVSYRYQTASDLTYTYEPEQNTAVATNSVNFSETPSHNYNYLSQPSTSVPAEIATDEHGNQILILCTGNPEPQHQPSVTTAYLQELQYNQQQQPQPQEQYQVIQHHQGGGGYHTVPAQPQVIVQHQTQNQQSNYYSIQQQQSQAPVQRYNTEQTVQGQLVCLDNSNSGYSIQLVHPSTKNVIASLPVQNNQVQHQQQAKQQQQQAQPTRINVQSQSQNVGQQNQHQVIVQPTTVVQQQSQQVRQQQIQQPIPIQQPLVQTQQQQPKVQYQSVIQKPPQIYQSTSTRPQLQQPVISCNPAASQLHPGVPLAAQPPSTYHSSIQQNQLVPPPPSVVPFPSTPKPAKTKARKDPKGKKNKNNDIICLTPLNSAPPQGSVQLPQPSAAPSVITPATGLSSSTPLTQSLVGVKGALVSRTADIVRISSGSSLPNSAEQDVAGKIHSAHLQSLTSSTAIPNSRVAVSSGQKTILILPSSPNSKSVNKDSPVSTNSGIATAQVADNRPTRKPGLLAVCPHCGSVQENIVQCTRCKCVFPETVKLVKDLWCVKKSEVTLAAAPPSAVTPVPSESKGVPANPLSTAKKAPQKKIVVVNKPAILNPSKKVITGSSVVEVKIQPDGGSSVAIIQSGSSGGSKVAVSKPPLVPRKRPAPRKKVQECITLSSDDEEPEPPKPKIVKVEETPNTTVAESCTSNCEKSGGNVAPSDPVSQAPVQEKIQIEQETLPAPLTVPVTPDNTDMAKRKGLTINLSPREQVVEVKSKDEETPEKVLGKIESEMNGQGSKFEFAIIACRSIRVGSYKVTDADTGPLKVTLTQLGIKFTLPYTNSKVRKVKICIPKNNILSIQANLTKRLPVIFLKTGPKFAAWIRATLGMDGNPENDYTNYYCPQKGSNCQRSITLLAESFSDADVGLVRRMYSDTLSEIDYHTANKFLMDITPDTYRSSINYQPDPDSPASSSKTVGTSSLTSTVVPSAQSPSTQNNISAGESSSTKSISTQSLSATPVASASSDRDQEATIWSYEGMNSKITICPKDIICLGHSQFLNDQIIDFWLSVIYTEILSDADRQRTFVFDSFFYSKLTEKKKRTAEDGALTAPERRHARVKKRTKNVDIFDRDFLIVPINENYHWFIVIICFPGMQGFHDYDTLTPLPNYSMKRPKLLAKSKPRPIVSKQPQNDSTASYSERDEAPEDPEEARELNNMEFGSSEDSQPSPSRPETVNDTVRKGVAGAGLKRKTEVVERRVKHPCILLFDSLAGDHRGRIYATLREYLKIEYKTKRGEDRMFDKNNIPGLMPKVPQQPNFSDCGLFMLQYIESFFADPLPTYDVKGIHLKSWFEPMIAENKRREIYSFIKKKIGEKCPQHLTRIPEVNFDPDGSEMDCDGHMSLRSLDSSLDDMDDDDPDYEDDDEEILRS